MPHTPQSYKNHFRVFPPHHLFVLPVLSINLVYEAREFLRGPSFETTLGLLVAAALVTLAVSSRVMALRVQDRIVRLEMRLRLSRLLPEDLRARIGELTLGQLVALRFAADAELPDLVRQVLANNLTKRDIKVKIKDWQGDYLRA